jgi:hypothetical protein
VGKRLGIRTGPGANKTKGINSMIVSKYFKLFIKIPLMKQLNYAYYRH